VADGERIGEVRAARATRAIDAAFPDGAPAADEAVREEQLDSLPASTDALFVKLEQACEEPTPHGSGRAILRLLYAFV
jgi:hypothetical protein